MKSYVVFVCLLGFYWSSNAQALVYKPFNPNFGGGETFGYQQLLSSADAQNDFKEDASANAFKQPTQAERFKENLNNQLLNRISSSLFNNQVGGGTGTGGLSPGTYNFGTLSVDIFESNLGLAVDILDIETGEQTQVIIPRN